MKKLFAIALGFGLFGATAYAQQLLPQKELAHESLKAKLDPALLPYHPVADVSGNIRVAGNLEHMEPLLKLWIADYKKLHPNVTFSFDTKNDDSGKAIPAMIEGTPDLTLIGRELKPKEVSDFHAKYGYNPMELRVAAGSFRIHGKSFAPVFFVNKNNPINQISLDQADAIYSSTRNRKHAEITTWGQLGATGVWANKPITLYGLNPAAGTRTYLRVSMLKYGEWKNGIKEATYVDGEADWTQLVDFIADDPTGIAYASEDHVASNPKVKSLALAEHDGGPYVPATFVNVANQKYPLSRFVYVNLNRKPGTPIEPRVKDFLTYILSRQGQQQILVEGDYLPMAASIVRQERSKLN